MNWPHAPDDPQGAAKEAGEHGGEGLGSAFSLLISVPALWLTGGTTMRSIP